MHSNEHNLNIDNEKKTLVIIIFTFTAMFAEIIFGYITNSMALLADGYHMGTHALALILTYAAYVLTRKFEGSDKFINGTDKIGTVAAYTSSLFLLYTGVWIIYEAVIRIMHPLKIQFNEAILVAVIGFIVNTVCILIMEYKTCRDNGHVHHHCRDCEHIHDDSCKDYNFKAAYYHILADAMTSIFAILALCAGKFFNITYFDPIIGILGGILILRWSVSLIKHTVKILIDMK